MADGYCVNDKNKEPVRNVAADYNTVQFEDDTYYLSFWFAPADGYTFADDLSITVDGVNNANVSFYDVDGFWIDVYIKFELTDPSPAPTEIDSIHIEGITAPQYGQASSQWNDVFNSNVDAGVMKINGSIGDDGWDFGDVFLDGKSFQDENKEHFYDTIAAGTYYVKLWLYHNEGFVFADGLSITVDGVNPANVTFRPSTVDEDCIIVWVKYDVSNPDHVHTPNTEWKFNTDYHWHECVGNDGQQFNKAKHIYDNACDKDCNECGATRTPAAHAYDNDCDKDCNECGEIRTTSHSYSSDWSYNSGKHWHECSVCHAKKDEASHTPGAAATETTPQICTVCSLVITPALNHTHSAKTEWSSDETYHWHDCIGNDAYQLDKAEHSYDNNCDADCSVCGFARTVLDHKDEDENGKCDSCGADMPGADPGPAPTPTPTPDPKPEKKGLSGGAIAAILIGATAVLASGGFAIYWFVIQKKSVEDLVVLVKKAFAPNVTEEIPEVNTEDNSEKSPEESNE